VFAGMIEMLVDTVGVRHWAQRHTISKHKGYRKSKEKEQHEQENGEEEEKASTGAEAL
jgi:hypothetical protein